MLQSHQEGQPWTRDRKHKNSHINTLTHSTELGSEQTTSSHLRLKASADHMPKFLKLLKSGLQGVTTGVYLQRHLKACFSQCSIQAPAGEHKGDAQTAYLLFLLVNNYCKWQCLADQWHIG